MIIIDRITYTDAFADKSFMLLAETRKGFTRKFEVAAETLDEAIKRLKKDRLRNVRSA